MRNVLFLSLASLAIVSGCAAERPAPTLPLRIGVLADSQITSPNGTPEGLYRTVSLDKRIDCAIRPPALEHLGAEVLGIALRQFPSDTDVILYLGDGANSGGADEIDSFFAVLSAYRRETGIPIFVVIGNHDYLGVGNTPNMMERFLILNRLCPAETPPLPNPYNRPLSKYEVLKRISDFNRQSSALPAGSVFKYTDNGDALDPNCDHSTGLYLAGYLAYPKREDPVVEIFLADTSDYADTRFKPEVRIWDPFVPAWDIYGMQGSISSVDRVSEAGRPQVSQMTYLREQAAANPPQFRFVAAHYHPDNLDRKRSDTPESWRFELVNFLHGTWENICTVCLGHRYANQQLAQWLSDGRNYWLSGHTHRTTMMHPAQGKVHVGGVWELVTDGAFRSINVGSTTDYRAHIALIEPLSREAVDNDAHVKKVDPEVQFREIPLFDGGTAQDAARLELLLESIEAYGCANAQTEHCIAYHDGRQFGFSLLGLNKDYQDDTWTVETTEISRRRLDGFIDTFLSDHPNVPRADVIRSLAFIASAFEAGACGARSGFDLAACSVD